MNWEAIGAISEFVGATAVVLTLVYVAIQIKQNTATSRAQIQCFQSTPSWPLLAVQLGHKHLSTSSAAAHNTFTVRRDHKI